MATKVCYQCRSDVHVLAKVCPNCRAKLGAAGAGGIAKKPTSAAMGCIVVFIAAIVFGTIMTLFTGGGSAAPAPPPVVVGHRLPARYHLADACPGIKTDAEMKDGHGCWSLQVTFYGKRPSNAAADKACRAYLAEAIKKFNDQDVLVTAWLRKRAGDDPDADEQIHPYPGTSQSGGVVLPKSLIYRAKSKAVVVD